MMNHVALPITAVGIEGYLSEIREIKRKIRDHELLAEEEPMSEKVLKRWREDLQSWMADLYAMGEALKLTQSQQGKYWEETQVL